MIFDEYGFWKSLLLVLFLAWVVVGLLAPLNALALAIWLALGVVIAIVLYAGGVRFRKRLRGDVMEGRH